MINGTRNSAYPLRSLVCIEVIHRFIGKRGFRAFEHHLFHFVLFANATYLVYICYVCRTH